MIGEGSKTLIAILAMASTTTIACETGRPGAPYVIPGPTGPSAVSTVVPYSWDLLDELSVWIDSKVSRGPVSMTGEGREAAIRIEIGPPSFSLENGTSVQWVLRGPDFDEPVRHRA